MQLVSMLCTLVAIDSLNLDSKDQYSSLICQQCQTQGQSIITLEEVQNYFDEWAQQIDCIENRFDKQIETLNEQIKSLIEQFNHFVEIIKLKSQFHQFYDQFTRQENIELRHIFDLANYFKSRNSINGKIVMKEHIKLPDNLNQEIDKSIEFIYQQITNLSSVLRQSIEGMQPNLVNNDASTLQFIYTGPITLYKHQDILRIMAISNDDKLIASGGYNKLIIWNQQTDMIQAQFNFDNAINTLEFSKDNKFLAASIDQQDSKIIIFMINKYLEIKRFTTIKSRSGRICQTIFSNNSKFLIFSSDRLNFQGKLMLWSINKNVQLVCKRFPSLIRSICVSNDMKYLCVHSHNLCQLFNVNHLQNKELLSLRIDKNVQHTTFTSDSLAIQMDDKLLFWTIESLLTNGWSKSPYRIFYMYKNLSTIEIRMNDDILVYCDGLVNIWNLKTADCVQTLPKINHKTINNFVVSRNMSYIITSYTSGEINKYLLIQ